MTGDPASAAGEPGLTSGETSNTEKDVKPISDPVTGVFSGQPETEGSNVSKETSSTPGLAGVGAPKESTPSETTGSQVVKPVPKPPSPDKQTPNLSFSMEEEETGKDHSAKEIAIGEDDFSEEQLHQLWDAYFENKKGVMSGIEYSILKKRPVLRESFVLDIAIKNGVEINILKKYEEELLGYLRRELNNSKISINHIQEEVKEEDHLYTDMDKFNDMARRNPVLLQLKERLGLDPEY